MHNFVVLPAFTAANVVAHFGNDRRAIAAPTDVTHGELALEDRHDAASRALAADANAFSGAEALSRVEAIDSVGMQIDGAVEDDYIRASMARHIDPEVGAQVHDRGAGRFDGET